MDESSAGNDHNSLFASMGCSRPKKGERMEKQRSAEAQRQYEKWKSTMERRMGKPIVEIMRENGRAGGKKGHAGKGYSAHPEMASEMGKRGAAKRWAKAREAKAQG